MARSVGERHYTRMYDGNHACVCVCDEFLARFLGGPYVDKLGEVLKRPGGLALDVHLG